LYHQAIWECEATGRQNLTYEQALESEKTEHSRAEFKFCQALRINILNRIKFRKYRGYSITLISLYSKCINFFFSIETFRLEALVNDVYSHFKNNYVEDEIVHCKLNDYKYVSMINNQHIVL
jgi:bromodomain adjacent to zinc finger domain protein 1A